VNEVIERTGRLSTTLLHNAPPIPLLPRGYGRHILLELGLAEGRSVGLFDGQYWSSLVVGWAQKRTEMRISFALPLRRAFRVLL